MTTFMWAIASIAAIALFLFLLALFTGIMGALWLGYLLEEDDKKEGRWISENAPEDDAAVHGDVTQAQWPKGSNISYLAPMQKEAM